MILPLNIKLLLLLADRFHCENVITSFSFIGTYCLSEISCVEVYILRIIIIINLYSTRIEVSTIMLESADIVQFILHNT